MLNRKVKGTQRRRSYANFDQNIRIYSNKVAKRVDTYIISLEDIISTSITLRHSFTLDVLSLLFRKLGQFTLYVCMYKCMMSSSSSSNSPFAVGIIVI